MFLDKTKINSTYLTCQSTLPLFLELNTLRNNGLGQRAHLRRFLRRSQRRLTAKTDSLILNSYPAEESDFAAKKDPEKPFILLIYIDKLSIILYINTAKESS